LIRAKKMTKQALVFLIAVAANKESRHEIILEQPQRIRLPLIRAVTSYVNTTHSLFYCITIRHGLNRIKHDSG